MPNDDVDLDDKGIPIVPYKQKRPTTVGYPTKLNRPLIDELETATLKGVHVNVLMARFGIARTVYYTWMEKGEVAKPGSLYREFYERISAAEAKAEELLVAEVRQMIRKKNDPKAALDFLSRRWPQRWSQKQVHEHTGAVKQDLTVTQRQEFVYQVGGNADAQRLLNEALRAVATADRSKAIDAQVSKPPTERNP